MTIYHITKPTQELKKYYNEQIKLPSPTFDRLTRTVGEDGDLKIVTYSLSDTRIQKSWGETFTRYFCCSSPSNDNSTILTGKSAAGHLAKDLEILHPLSTFKRAVKRVIQLRLGKGMEKIVRKRFTGAMLHSDYWCEALHPKHYAWALSYELFRSWLHDTETDYSFVQWLKTSDAKIFQHAHLRPFRKNKELCLGSEKDPIMGGNIPKVDLQKIKVKVLLTSMERAEFLVRLDVTDPNAPRFVKQQNGNSLTGTNLYVIDCNSKIYATPKIVHSFHHSSLVAMGAVICAGIVKTTDEGVIEYIDTKSGHYKPTKTHFLEGLAILQKQRLKIPLGNLLRKPSSGGYSPPKYTWIRTKPEPRNVLLPPSSR